MVAIASPRMIVCPMRIITDEHTHASRRAPESLRKILELLQKQNCGGRGEVTPLRLQVGRVVEGLVTHGTAPSIGHGFRRTRRGNERQAPALALYGGDVVPRIQVEELHGLRVTGLPRCEAPRMDVMRLQSGRAAVVGELDLDFQLVRRDEKVANRAGSPNPAAAPGAIRRPRRQFSPSDRRAHLCSKPRLVRHLVS